jgi:hypothetical protein
MLDLKIDEILNKMDLEQLESIAYRKSFLIDVLEELKPPQTAWGLKNASNDEVSILGTLGNFSLIIGKAKAKKSFFINLAVSCALSNEPVLNRFINGLPDNQREVLYMDTEQGKYHVQLAVRRICKQLNVSVPNNLFTYHLRSLTPAQRLKLIQEEIYSNDKIGLVVIDGIVDLITSINDEAEATMIASKLLKWTEERNIHIITVLHQNKSDNNARGHVGSSLTHKAETVLSITKEESNPDVSTMKAEFCRNREPEPFSFEITEEGLPVEAVGFEARSKERKSSFVELEDYKKYSLLTEVFSHGIEFKYASLQSQIKVAYQTQYKGNLSNNKIVDLITYCKNSNWLNQSGTGQPYTLLEFIPL